MDQASVGRMTILCVDADPEIRDTIGRMLSERFPAHEAVFAANGVDAVVCIGEVRPDILILDLGLPEYDCALVSKEIHMQDKKSRTIALSSNEEDTFKCSKLNIEFSVSKPVDVVSLFAKLDEMLSGISGERPAAEKDVFDLARSAFGLH